MKNSTLILLVIGILGGLILCACISVLIITSIAYTRRSASTLNSSKSSANLTRTWKLTKLVVKGKQSDAIPNKAFILQLRTSGEFGGIACNSFGGSYTNSDNSIMFQDLTATEMACTSPAGIMEQETALFSLLQSARSFSFSAPNTLRILHDDSNYADFVLYPIID